MNREAEVKRASRTRSELVAGSLSLCDERASRCPCIIVSHRAAGSAVADAALEQSLISKRNSIRVRPGTLLMQDEFRCCTSLHQPAKHVPAPDRRGKSGEYHADRVFRTSFSVISDRLCKPMTASIAVRVMFVSVWQNTMLTCAAFNSPDSGRW